MAVLLFAVPDALHANFRHVAGTTFVRAQMHRDDISTLLHFVKVKWVWHIAEHPTCAQLCVLQATSNGS